MLMRHMKHQVAGEYAWYSAQAQCRTHFYTLWQREGEGGATSPQTQEPLKPLCPWTTGYHIHSPPQCTPLMHPAFALINPSLCQTVLPPLLISILGGPRTPALVTGRGPGAPDEDTGSADTWL